MSFDALDIGASGMFAQRLKMDTISSNIANVNTTRNQNGEIEPYAKKNVVFSAVYDETRKGPVLPSQSLQPGYDSTAGEMVLKGRVSYDSPLISNGVEVAEITEDNNFKVVYDPSHPDANEDGFVKMPNINIVTEMVDMMMASRAYEANVASIEAAKSMISSALKIGG